MSTYIDEQGFEIIRMDQTPSKENGKWKLIPLYKYNELGNLMMCQIGFDGDQQQLLLIHGLVEGKTTPQIDGHKITTNNSGRTIQEQALLEAKNEFKKRFREKGYRPEGEDLKDIMLMRGIKWGASVDIAIPFGIMAKLDGVRGGCKLTAGDRVKIRSSKNVEYDYLDHIRDELKPFFAYLPPNAEIDCEIYNSKFTLYEINSIVRTSKIVHQENREMRIYIFDLIYGENHPYEQRYEILKNSYESYKREGGSFRFVFLLPLYIVYKKEEILGYYNYFLDLGYEGLIVRCLAQGAKTDAEKKKALYQSGKCNHFYKLKPFEDEEGTIIGMENGKGKYEDVARLVLKDPRGNKITVLHHGTVKEKEAAYENWKRNPNEYLGRLYKYKFQGLTEKGKPRHPTGISYRDVDQPPPGC